MTFPDDENGEILTEMAEAGLDFSKTYTVDFFAAFEFEDKAKDAISIVEALAVNDSNFKQVVVSKAESGNGYELIASLDIKLEHALITTIDDAFTVCVEKLRGYADGWGVEL